MQKVSLWLFYSTHFDVIAFPKIASMGAQKSKFMSRHALGNKDFSAFDIKIELNMVEIVIATMCCMW